MFVAVHGDRVFEKRLNFEFLDLKNCQASKLGLARVPSASFEGLGTPGALQKLAKTLSFSLFPLVMNLRQTGFGMTVKQ